MSTSTNVSCAVHGMAKYEASGMSDEAISDMLFGPISRGQGSLPWYPGFGGEGDYSIYPGSGSNSFYIASYSSQFPVKILNAEESAIQIEIGKCSNPPAGYNLPRVRLESEKWSLSKSSRGDRSGEINIRYWASWSFGKLVRFQRKSTVARPCDTVRRAFEKMKIPLQVVFIEGDEEVKG